MTDFRCFGPQNDLTVWDRDANGSADLLIASVDRTLTGPNCGATATDHDDPAGWEGLRLFDISNGGAPVQIGAVYQDCGSHTHTLIPQSGRLVVLNSSYPLKPGPTCGPVTSGSPPRCPDATCSSTRGTPGASTSSTSRIQAIRARSPSTTSMLTTGRRTGTSTARRIRAAR